MSKRHILVMYGGRSAEHEISCRSAAFVLRNLDPKKYTVHAVAIDKAGRWLPQDAKKLKDNLNGPVPIANTYAALPALPASQDPGSGLLALASRDQGPVTREDLVVFPVLHGTFGEDGTMQGLLDLAELAYVGPDTLGSAIGMDKVVAKRLAVSAGVPVVPWVDIRRQFYTANPKAFLDRAATLGFPLFVKPARLGSSIGISKAKDLASLKIACEEAFQFDDKILVEKGLEVREIECAVLGDYDPMVSVPGEVVAHAEFYSYDAKYIDADGAHSVIPAKLTEAQAAEARDISKRVFMALELYGMARVDLFLEKSTGKYFLNEVNTIPGLTEISQYPLLWKETGVPPSELLDRLIDLAVKRRDVQAGLKRSKD